MLRRILPALPEHVQFLLTDADVGLTFAQQALQSPVGSEARQHYTLHAKRAMDTVMRFRTRVHLTAEDDATLEAVLGPLCALVDRLTTGRPFMTNDSRAFLVQRGKKWTLMRAGDIHGEYETLDDAMAAGTMLAFQHRTDLLLQQGGAWETVRSYRPITPGSSQ